MPTLPRPLSRICQCAAALVLSSALAHAQVGTKNSQLEAPSASAVDAAPEPKEQDASAAATESAADPALQAALAADSASAAGDAASAQPDGARGPASGGVQSMNPDLAVIADVAAAYFSADEPLQGGGHDPTVRGFNLQQLELSLGAAVDPYFRFDANIVFALDGVEIEEVYATTLDLPYRLQLRAGQFLTRFGRLNPTHPHSWDFVDQPFALTRLFGGEGNRGLGLELSWLAPLPWYVELVGSATQAGGSETARSFLSDDDLTVHGLTDFEFVTALKQFFPLSDDVSLAWGLSGAFGPNSSGRDGGSQVYGTDVYLKWRPITYQTAQQVTLQLEWFYRRRQAQAGTVQDTDGFAALAWRFAQRWAVAARYEFGSPALDAGFRSTPDPFDPDWAGSRHRVALNTTFWPSEFSRIRLQGSVDRPGWKETPSWAVFVAFEVVAGAHGAHAF